jgi:hypothetical protein
MSVFTLGKQAVIQGMNMHTSHNQLEADLAYY